MKRTGSTYGRHVPTYELYVNGMDHLCRRHYDKLSKQSLLHGQLIYRLAKQLNRKLCRLDSSLIY